MTDALQPKVLRSAAWGKRKHMKKVFGGVGALAGSAMVAAAQSTGTNTTTLIADNITNASNVLTPIAIGVSIIWIVWRLIKKVGSKAG